MDDDFAMCEGVEGQSICTTCKRRGRSNSERQVFVTIPPAKDEKCGLHVEYRWEAANDPTPRRRQL